VLQAVEPSILGVQVAYGGYVAFGAVTPEGAVKLTPPVMAAAASAPASSGGSS
jgi:hypothetical protein